jgi:AsmA protein
MLRSLKYLGLGLAGLLILLLLLVISLLTFVNPNKFKPQLAQYIQAATGRDIEINGNIHWTFLPRFGLKVSDVQVENPANFPKQAFLQVQAAEVKLSLLPLLHKQIVAEQLLLSDIHLNLIKNKAGLVNWQLTPKANGGEPASATQVAAAPLALNIAKFVLKDGSIDYWDQQAEKRYAIQGLQFRSEQVGLNHGFPFKLQFNLDSPQSGLQGEVKLQAKLNLNSTSQRYAATELKLELNLQGNKLVNGKQNIVATTDIVLTPQQLLLSPITVILDKNTTVKGRLSKNLSTKAISFNFDIPELNLGTQAKPEQQTQPASSASSALLPLLLLRDLSADGSVHIARLVVNELNIQDVRLNLIASNGIIQLAPIQAKLYQGSYSGQLSIDARTNIPSLATQHMFKGVEIRRLLSALDKQTRFPLTGKSSVSLQLTTLGNDKNTWLSNLNGNAFITMEQGSIQNVNLDYELQKIRNFIAKQPQPKLQGPNQTRFHKLSANLQISNGVANNQDFILQADTAMVKGQGIIDLRNQNLDYRLQLSATSSNLGSDIYKIQDNLGGSFPLVVKGNWSSPSVQPDWSIISQAIAKAIVNEQTADIKSRLSEQLDKQVDTDTGKRLKQALASLLG